MKGEKYFYNFLWEAAGMIRIGIDVGGTDIKVGAVSREGELLGCLSAPTGADRPFEAVVADMAQGVNRLLKQMGLPRRRGTGTDQIAPFLLHEIPRRGRGTSGA